MRSHILVNLALAPFLVTGEPMPPPATQPRADARTLACTAAHLAIHTAVTTSEPSPSPLPTATTQPVTTPNRRVPPPVSVEELKPAILTPRDVTFSQMTEGNIGSKLRRSPSRWQRSIPDSPSKAVSWRRLHHRSCEEESHETPEATTDDVQRPADRSAAGGLRVPAAAPVATPAPPTAIPIPPTPVPATAEPSTGATAKTSTVAEAQLEPHQPRPDAPPYGVRDPTQWVCVISSSTHRSARYL